MSSRFVSAAILAAALFVGSVSAALAETYQVSLGAAAALMSFPDSWKITQIKRGLQAVSPDGEVYIWVEAYAPKQLDALVKEHEEYFDKQKVTLGEPKSHEGAVNGMKMVALDFPATWKGKKTVVQYLLVNPGVKNNTQLMLSNWSSVKGDKMYQKETDAMVASMKIKQ
jgi:hypothetical protein